jgi:hypothetical protein
MPTYLPGQAHCFVLTKKEGLLSPIAHDLRLRVADFEIQADSSRIEARFQARSLEVVAAQRHGADAPGLLSDRDKRQIQKNIATDVLQASRYPEIRFLSTRIEANGDGFKVTGDLTLCGRTRSLTATAKRAGPWLESEVVLNQPDWGIKPFAAMLGTLRVQPLVTVRISVPVP